MMREGRAREGKGLGVERGICIRGYIRIRKGMYELKGTLKYIRIY